MWTRTTDQQQASCFRMLDLRLSSMFVVQILALPSD